MGKERERLAREGQSGKSTVTATHMQDINVRVSLETEKRLERQKQDAAAAVRIGLLLLHVWRVQPQTA
jgi:hypothetical protein